MGFSVLRDLLVRGVCRAAPGLRRSLEFRPLRGHGPLDSNTVAHDGTLPHTDTGMRHARVRIVHDIS